MAKQYIHARAAEGNCTKIQRYIMGIGTSIGQGEASAFCGNETVNLILSAFHAQAAQHGIALAVQADLPPDLGLPDPDLYVILSNALENAVRATAPVKDREKRSQSTLISKTASSSSRSPTRSWDR